MEPFKVVTGIAAPMLMPNINTDAITPMAAGRSTSVDLGKMMFNNWRYNLDGSEIPDHQVLAQTLAVGPGWFISIEGGVPIAVGGAASAFFIVSANAWMNTPTGFTLLPDGTVTEIGARPAGVTAQQWFNRLTEHAGTHYAALSGGRGLFRLPAGKADSVRAKALALRALWRRGTAAAR